MSVQNSFNSRRSFVYSRAQRTIANTAFLLLSLLLGLYLHLDAKHISDACPTVHEHVQQTTTLIDDPSSIRLKENRARTGHFAVHQQ